MPRILIAFVGILLALNLAKADPLPATDRAAVEQVITQQLQAFASDQAELAYGYAAPVVKFAFPSVEGFMNMVKQGYRPVYRNSGYEFGESFTDPTGRPAQKVVITGTDGKNYEAVYFMEKQPDGSWKIAGCVLLTLPDVNA